MNIAMSNKEIQPVLTADAIRKEIPLVSKKGDGTFKSEGAIKNIISGFNQMIKRGLLSEDCLLTQMESEFTLIQNKVLQYSKLHSEAKSWPSFLNTIRAAGNSLVQFDTQNMTFRDTFRVLAKRELGVHLSDWQLVSELAKLEPSFNETSLWGWLNGRRHPYATSADTVNKLDKILNANGALNNKTKQAYIKPKKDLGAKKEKIDTVPLSDELQAEVDMYCAWQTLGIKPPKMSYLADSLAKTKGQKRKIRQLKNVKSSKWQTSSLGEVTSAFKVNNQIQLFAKYIKSSHPERLADLSLSTPFNHELLEGFCEYGRSRMIISSTLEFLSWLSSECGENSYASVYLRSEAVDCEDIDDWLSELSLLKKDIKIASDSLIEDKVTLDGARNVEWILNKENSFDYINTISDALWTDAKYSIGYTNYSNTSTALIFDVLLSCPVRFGNVASLLWKGRLSEKEVYELHKTEICAVYWDISKEHYVLFVHKQQLKNRRAKKINSIIQPLPHLTDKIDKYIEVRNHHLASKGWSADFFFVKVNLYGKPADSIPPSLQRTYMGTSFSSHTKAVIDHHFPEENVDCGINPHGMRHLTASLYLRDNPDDYTGLATLLMDNLNTVINTYAKRADKDNHNKISQWIMGKTHA